MLVGSATRPICKTTIAFVTSTSSALSILYLKLTPSSTPCPATRRYSTRNDLKVYGLLKPRPNPRSKRTMAWTCSATTNDGLVDNLVKEDIVNKPRVEQVLRLVDRRLFLPDDTSPVYAYADSPQTLPCSATISAPHMHAMALQLLHDHLKPGHCALDVGAGSGYIAACMAALVGQNGKVYAIEHAPELSQFAQRNLNTFQQMIPNSTACQVHVTTGDGRLGDPIHAPYDAIHVGAAAPDVPQALIDQLAPGGSMVIPIGPAHGSQSLDVVSKDDDGKVSHRTVCHVRYVPLTNLREQLRNEL